MKKYSDIMVRLKELNITYVELAKELGITPSALSNKLNGKYDFRLEELKKILEIIGEKDKSEICKLLNLK